MKVKTQRTERELYYFLVIVQKNKRKQPKFPVIFQCKVLFCFWNEDKINREKFKKIKRRKTLIEVNFKVIQFYEGGIWQINVKIASYCLLLNI